MEGWPWDRRDGVSCMKRSGVSAKGAPFVGRRAKSAGHLGGGRLISRSLERVVLIRGICIL